MTTNDSIEIRNDLKTILDRGAHLPYIEFCDGKYSFFAMDCCHSILEYLFYAVFHFDGYIYYEVHNTSKWTRLIALAQKV